MDINAVIDLGSNTVRLLIAEVVEDHPPSRFRVLYQAQEITRLGEEVSRTKRIKGEAVERTLSLLAAYSKMIADYGPRTIEVVGTGALREARNAKEFVERVEGSLGWKIRILTPQEEAHLGLLGVRYSSADLPAKLIILDIGGSSTEIAQAEGLEMKHSVSLPLGAVALYERFLGSDPPSAQEIQRILSFLAENLRGPFSPFAFLEEHLLIGTAGTVTTLAAIHLGLEEYDPEQVNDLTMTQSEIRKLFNQMCEMPLAQRTELPGLEERRADIILSGVAILLVVLEVLHRNRIRISDGGLREGILLNLLGKGD